MVASISAASLVTTSAPRRAHPSLAAPTADARRGRSSPLGRAAAAEASAIVADATVVVAVTVAVAVAIAVAPTSAMIVAAAPWAPGRSPPRTLPRLLTKVILACLRGSLVLCNLVVIVQVFD